MPDERITVLEKQHDELAGRVASLEEQLKSLRRLLGRPNVTQRLGITVEELEPLAGTWTASSEESRQYFARLQALQTERRNALLRRVEKVERYARVYRKSFAEAWDACAKRD